MSHTKDPHALSLPPTESAIALVSRHTPSSKKLKQLLSGLAEGFQQAIADKALEGESHKLYLVTTETVLHLRENRERLDAEKASKKKVPVSSEDIIPTIESGEESTDWEDSGDSDGSIYKGHSEALHGANSTNTPDGKEDNTGESVGIDGRDGAERDPCPERDPRAVRYTFLAQSRSGPPDGQDNSSNISLGAIDIDQDEYMTPDDDGPPCPGNRNPPARV
ncbi:hypothetical protein HOY80DRAFT_1049033 [Tuber brumale]|nr:hypothetical protein HOY80DRAFT_1049033 [Tuber brumale]